MRWRLRSVSLWRKGVHTDAIYIGRHKDHMTRHALLPLSSTLLPLLVGPSGEPEVKQRAVIYIDLGAYMP